MLPLLCMLSSLICASSYASQAARKPYLKQDMSLNEQFLHYACDPLVTAPRDGSELPVEPIIRQLRALKDKGANINAQESNGEQTALMHTACFADRIKILRELISMGADMNMQDEDGETALHWAVQTKNVAAIRELLMAGADIHRKNKYKVSFAMYLDPIYADDLEYTWTRKELCLSIYNQVQAEKKEAAAAEKEQEKE